MTENDFQLRSGVHLLLQQPPQRGGERPLGGDDGVLGKRLRNRGNVGEERECLVALP